MAGKILKMGGGIPCGNNKEFQYNNAGVFGGCAQAYWDNANNRLGLGDNTPAKQLSLTKCMELLTTTTSDIGIIYKGANRFIHDFHHPTGGGAVPEGNNFFAGTNAGNFTMGSGATLGYHGSYNLGFGTTVFLENTLGYHNVAVGNVALKNNTEGYYNIAIGTKTLERNTVGFYNTAIGAEVLKYNISGYYNVGIGTKALLGVATSSNVLNNIAIGYEAGKAILTGGDGNILIGFRAGDNVTTGATNIIIGYNLDALSAVADDQLNIGSLIFGSLGATKRVGINTSTMNETLNVGGAIRLGTTALTNAGAIRWTGADFEGYTGAAWSSLTGSQWTDHGAYVYPTGAPDLNRVEVLQSSFDVAANRQGIRIEVDTDSTSDTYEHTGVLVDAKIAHTVTTVGEPIAWLSFHSKIEVDGDAADGRTWGFMDSITRGNLTNSRGHWGYHVEFDCNGTHSFADNEQDLTGYMCGNSGTEKMNDAFFFDASTGGAYAAMCITGNMDFGLEFIAPTFNTAAIAFGNAQHITTRASAGATNYQLLGMNASDNIEVGLNAPGLIILGYNAVSNNPINIWVGGANKAIEVGAADSGGAGYKMLRVAN